MEEAWIERYQTPTLTIWQGRVDGQQPSRFHQIIQPIDLRQISIAQDCGVFFCILGFACEEGIKRNQGRIGASEGPNAFRQAMARLPFHFPSNVMVYDAGTITCLDGELEQSQKALKEAVAIILKSKAIPIVIGGGHETAWGHFQGIQSAKLNECALINFDAHFDLRIPQNHFSTSGTSFQQIAEWYESQQLPFNYGCLGIQETSNPCILFERAKHQHVQTVLADDFHLNGSRAAMKVIDTFIAQCKSIYLSLCLDVVAAPFAPGVSSPQPLGLFPWHILPLLKCLASSKKVISLDVVELSPRHDRDAMTAHLAASFVSTFIHAYSQSEKSNMQPSF